MSLARVVHLALLLSIGTSMFAIGLVTRRAALLDLWRHPIRLGKSVAAMYVVMPVLAVAIVVSLRLHPALEVALVALSVSPVSPLIAGKELKAGGRDAYVISLLVTTAILAVVAVPSLMHLMSRSFGATPPISGSAIAKVVLTSVLAPLSAGIVVHTLAGGFAERIAPPLQRVSAVLLIAGALPLLVKVLPAFVTLAGDGTLLAIAGTVVLALGVGHLLGGPGLTDQTVLAMSTTSRHPAVAVAIASATAPEQRLSAAAIILYLVLSSVGVGLYSRWVKRFRFAEAAEMSPLFPPAGGGKP